jgi:putative molybdopterin biosynthesis protein
MAIRRNEAHLAGCHLLDEETGEYNISYIKRFLPDVPLRLINLCYRQQGFIVLKNNPKKIKSFSDIAQNGYTFINRQGGAGTRLLTDKTLRQENIRPTEIQGYGHEEYTHMSVAAAVASGGVDTGMGILAAAKALNLDFVPVAEERYDLIIPERFINDVKVIATLELLATNRKFQQEVVALGGYDLRDCGKTLYQQ